MTNPPCRYCSDITSRDATNNYCMPRIFTMTAVLSLVLFMLIVAAWMRSYKCHDSADFGRSPSFYFVANTQYGGFNLRLLTGQHFTQRPPSLDSYVYSSDIKGYHPRHVIFPSYKSFDGSDESLGTTPIPTFTQYAEIPYWLILLLAALMPALWAVSWSRRREWLIRSTGEPQPR